MTSLSKKITKQPKAWLEKDALNLSELMNASILSDVNCFARKSFKFLDFIYRNKIEQLMLRRISTP